LFYFFGGREPFSSLYNTFSQNGRGAAYFSPKKREKQEKILGEKSMQRFDKRKYMRLVKARERRSPVFKNLFAAFFVGGSICLLGEALFSLYRSFGWEEKTAGVTVTVSLIFLSALLTFLGVFDRIARFAGAGTLLPVTGFANAVVSPAMDNKSEGFVMGVGAKMFIVAGPVIVYGTAAGTVLGLIYYFLSR
jgi:stage V sporulation protein AC